MSFCNRQQITRGNHQIRPYQRGNGKGDDTPVHAYPSPTVESLLLGNLKNGDGRRVRAPATDCTIINLAGHGAGEEPMSGVSCTNAINTAAHHRQIGAVASSNTQRETAEIRCITRFLVLPPPIPASMYNTTGTQQGMCLDRNPQHRDSYQR